MTTIVSVTGRHIAPLIDGWQLALTAADAATEPGALPPALDWIAAVVPGTAAQALRDAGRWSLDRPTALHDHDVWYRTRFAAQGRRRLRFQGLATLAEVWLNGTRVLAGDNMFLTHEIEAELSGDNDLAIVFRSLDKALAGRKGRARWRTRLVENNALRLVRTTLLGHMTGWQPPVHAVGPWRPIEIIEEAGPLRVRSAQMQATLDGDDGILTISLDIEQPASSQQLPARIEAGHVQGPLAWTGDDRIQGTLRLPRVAKWWPHTHGTPALHRVCVRVGDIEIDLGRTGFRALEVDRGGDGKGFALALNGQRIFARGACWSAADLVSLAGDRDRLRPWLEQARAAHMNMVRVTGTMIYESGAFFALCDELGILVWHDFMFANMDYPIGDPAFLAGVETEAVQFLDRTQGHPSLAVLCGASEVAQQAAMLGLPPTLWSSPLFDEILPRATASRRPEAIYLPQSPSGGDLPFSTDHGVSHYYGVGAFRRPLEDARRAHVRFASECLAFANIPDGASPGVPWDDAERWKQGVPRDRGATWDFEDVTDHYIGLLYGLDAGRLRVENPSHHRRLGRAATAEVMEAVLAEWRRPGSTCAGALVWLLKDFTPGAGWGVIDSTGAPKLAWHALRRAFRPVQVTVTDEGLNGLGIHVLNETAATVRATLSLHCLQDARAAVIHRERTLDLAPRSGVTLTSADLIGSFFDITYAYRFGPPPLDAAVVTLVDATTGARLSEAAHFPLGRGALGLDCGLGVELIHDQVGNALRLHATRLAPCVQIEDAHHRADDQGFLLLPGEERTVRLVAATGANARPSGRIFSGAGTDEVGY